MIQENSEDGIRQAQSVLNMPEWMQQDMTQLQTGDELPPMAMVAQSTIEEGRQPRSIMNVPEWMHGDMTQLQTGDDLPPLPMVREFTAQDLPHRRNYHFNAVDVVEAA